MNSVFFFKNDFSCWLRKNVVRLIVLGVLAVFALVIAVRNAMVLEDVQESFSGGGSALCGFLYGDVSVVNLLFRLLFEWALMLAFVLLCSYNDVTVYCACAVVPYKAYTSFYNLVIVARACMFGSIFFCVAHVLATAASLIILAVAIIETVDSGHRFCFGMREFKCLARTAIPLGFFVVLLVLLELILYCVSRIFI